MNEILSLFYTILIMMALVLIAGDIDRMADAVTEGTIKCAIEVVEDGNAP